MFLQPPGIAAPTALGSNSPGLGGQADVNMIGGPGIVIPTSLGQATTMANIPPPGVLNAGLPIAKPLPKGR